jgi:hypothetical protein
VWDFAGAGKPGDKKWPLITGVFYSDLLIKDDWGKISGTTGRNTKVTGMRISGKHKMGQGWILVLDEERYLERYQHILGFRI